MPVELHHIRRYGAVRKDCDVLPLCVGHHRGNDGVHGLGTKAFEKHYGITYDELLDIVEKRLQFQPIKAHFKRYDLAPPTKFCGMM